MQQISGLPGSNTFRNEVDGKIVTNTPPMSNDLADDGSLFYRSSRKNISMFRPDGKRIIFAGHFFEADIYSDQVYLEHEIRQGHRDLRRANADETRQLLMEKNPREVISDELRHDPQFVASVENELIAKLIADGKLPADFQRGLLGGSEQPAGERLDEAKIASTETAQQKLERLRNGRTFDTPGGVTVQKLNPVSTNDLAGAQAASGS